MLLPLQIVGYIAAISLQVLILHAMFDEGRRRYPFVFLYVCADLITNLVEIYPNLSAEFGSAEAPSLEAKRHWAMIFWWDERIILVLLFLLILSLIYRASISAGAPHRTLMTALVLGTVLIAGISLLIHYDPTVTTGKWVSLWSRDMNFCAAILDLLLWATLLRTRQKDRAVLMISGALGLQFTAAAVGQSLRDIAHIEEMVIATSLLMVGANVLCLYIWWNVFRKTPAKRPLQT